LTTVDLSGGLPDSAEYGLADYPHKTDMREGLNVWVLDEQGRFGFPRVCLEAMGPDFDPVRLQINLAFADGRILIGEDRGAAGPAEDENGRRTIWTGGPLEFRLIAPWKGWAVSYEGTAIDTTTRATIERRTAEAPRVPLRFAMEVEIAAPPWEHGQAGGDELGGADATFVGGPKTFESGLRYEQLIRARGTLEVADERWSFEGPGLRVHRQGLRNLTGFTGHIWQSALFPSGRGVRAMWLKPTDYREASVFDGTRVVPARLAEVSWMTSMLPEPGEDVSFVLETEHGSHEIRGETVFSRYIPFGDEFETEGLWPLHWQQAGVRYTWDGEETFGMLERSYTPPEAEARA
jgi:hypothetical protein